MSNSEHLLEHFVTRRWTINDGPKPDPKRDQHKTGTRDEDNKDWDATSAPALKEKKNRLQVKYGLPITGDIYRVSKYVLYGQ